MLVTSSQTTTLVTIRQNKYKEDNVHPLDNEVCSRCGLQINVYSYGKIESLANKVYLSIFFTSDFA